jgi:hypothetical protein
MSNMMVVRMGDVVQKWRHRSAKEPYLKISRPLRKTQERIGRLQERLRPYREKSAARIKDSIKARMAHARAAKTQKHRARIHKARKKKSKKKTKRRRR